MTGVQTCALPIYSSAGAREVHARGKRASLASAIGHGAWTFFRTYVLKRGFLDGAEGLMLAISNAETSYYKYMKLRELGRRSENPTERSS